MKSNKYLNFRGKILDFDTNCEKKIKFLPQKSAV